MTGTGEYLLGMAALVAIGVSMAIAGRTLRRALLPGWGGAPALLASGLLAIATLVAVSELLGLAGILDGVLLTAACVIVGGGALRLEPLVISDARKREGAEGERDALPVSDRELWVAVAVALLVAVQWAGPALLALDRGIYGGDSLWYHMPFAAHIAQTGSVTELLFTDPLYLNWFYPQVSELLHADGLLLLGNDFLSPLLNLAWLGLALFAAWCCGRPYGAGAPAVAAVAALMSANLLFSRQPGNANNDVVAIALLVSSVAILLNARQATARGPLLVAGLAAGLALGTKLTVVPPVGALTIGVIVLAALGAAEGRASRTLRAAGAWLAGLVVGGGLWYARNLIVSGTPFPFVDIGPLSMPEELQGREPFSITHYLTDTDVWGRFFRPALEERLGDLWPLVLLLAVAGVAVWLWRGGAVERMLAAVAVVAALAYLLTPLGASGPEGSPVGFRLNIRYLAPGLAIVRRSRDVWRIAALALFGALTALNAIALEPIDMDRIPGSLLLALAVVTAPVAIVMLARNGVPWGALAVGGLCAAIPRSRPTTRATSSRRSSSARASAARTTGPAAPRTRASAWRAPPARSSSTGSGASIPRTRSASSASASTGEPSPSTTDAPSGWPPSTPATTTTSSPPRPTTRTIPTRPESRSRTPGSPAPATSSAPELPSWASGASAARSLHRSARGRPPGAAHRMTHRRSEALLHVLA